MEATAGVTWATTDGRDAIVGSSLLIDPREPVYNEDGSIRPYIGGKRRSICISQSAVQC